MPPPKDETAEQREARLIKARKKASNVREEKMIEKYKNKVLEKVKTEKEENGNENEDEISENENENEEANVKPVKEIIPKPIPMKETKEPKEIKCKSKKKEMKSKVIIEQSSDDDDVFEDKPNVIFVKRVRPKPKINELVQQPNQQPNQQPQLVQQQSQQQQQRPPPPPPQRPALTPEKRLHMQQYINMTQGHFLPVCRPR
jgi:hypothetical protein